MQESYVVVRAGMAECVRLQEELTAVSVRLDLPEIAVTFTGAIPTRASAEEHGPEGVSTMPNTVGLVCNARVQGKAMSQDG